jgi:hypothetical protein
MSSTPQTVQSLSQTKRFGRTWRVEINTAVKQPNAEVVQEQVITFGSEGVNAWQPEQLHVQFEVNTVAITSLWFANIVIYNLNRPTLQKMIKYGMTVKLFAGYQSDQQPGQIYEGTIFQPIWEREGGINLKLTLRCLTGHLVAGDFNYAWTTVSGYNSIRNIVAAMAAGSKYTFKVTMDPEVYANADPITRATAFFGQPDEMARYMASTTNSLMWWKNEELVMKSLQSSTLVEELEYDENNGLIDVPEMMENGVTVRVLLDSRAKLLMQLKLAPSVVIRQQQFTPNLDSDQKDYPTMLDIGGEYTIAKVTHVGDTRGNDWYTEMTGMIKNANLLGLIMQI